MSKPRVGLRVVAAIVLNYVLTTAAVALLGALLGAAGMQPAEAVALASMLGFVMFTGISMACFVQLSVARLYGWMSVASVVCAVLAWVMLLTH
jgi:hypothetical protein